MLLACGMRGLGGAGGWGWCTFFSDLAMIVYTKWVGCKYMHEIVLYCVHIAVLVCLFFFFLNVYLLVSCVRDLKRKLQTLSLSLSLYIYIYI